MEAYLTTSGGEIIFPPQKILITNYMKSKKTIGILGGMGPAASSYMLSLIIKQMQSEYLAVQDQDFPNIILHSVGVQGFDEKGNITNEGAKQILAEAKKIEVAGAHVLLIACNTAHVLTHEIRQNLSIPFVSLVETTCQYVSKLGVKKVGILSSETSAEHDLYGVEFSKKGIASIYPDSSQKKLITEAIVSVMGGTNTNKESAVVESIGSSLLKEGAEIIVLGCTELPLLFKDVNSDKYVEPMNVAIQQILTTYNVSCTV